MTYTNVGNEKKTLHVSFDALSGKVETVGLGVMLREQRMTKSVIFGKADNLFSRNGRTILAYGGKTERKKYVGELCVHIAQAVRLSEEKQFEKFISKVSETAWVRSKSTFTWALTCGK